MAELMVLTALGVALTIIGLVFLVTGTRLTTADHFQDTLLVLGSICVLFAVGFIAKGTGMATPLDAMLNPPPPLK